MHDIRIGRATTGDDGGESTLYERDFVLWLQEQATLLRTRQLDLLDLDNLMEEIEAMAGNHRRELRHRLETLLMHLLKWQFQPDHRSGSWLGTIEEQRSSIEELIAQSPSLDRHVEE